MNSETVSQFGTASANPVVIAVSTLAPKRRRGKQVKPLKARKPLRREIDLPLADIGNRIFEPENADLHAQRAALLQCHWIELRAVISETHPLASWETLERILQKLAHRTSQFRHVPLDSAEFLSWASTYVRIQARRERLFDEIVGDEKNLLHIRMGIWSILKDCYDLGVTRNPQGKPKLKKKRKRDVEPTEDDYESSQNDGRTGTICEVYDIQAEVLKWVYRKLWGLAGITKPRTAQLTTGLYDSGQYHAMTWRNARISERDNREDFDEFVDYIEQNEKVPKLPPKPKRKKAEVEKEITAQASERPRANFWAP